MSKFDKFIEYITVIDFFPIKSTFRVSATRTAYHSPLGAACSLTIIALTMIYLTQRLEVLTQRNATNVSQLNFANSINGSKLFNYTINKPDSETNWVPRVAFGIYDVNGFKEPDDMARIGKIKAYMYKLQIDSISKKIERKYVPFKLHSCSQDDLKLFEMLGTYQDVMRVFRCIDEGQTIDLLGDFTQDNQNIFTFEFEKCNQTDKSLNCYNSTEIDKRVRQFGGYVIYSTQRFAIDKYDGQAIKDEVKLFFFTIQPEITQEIGFILKQQQAVTHDKETFSLFKDVVTQNYIELSKTDVTSLSWIDTDAYFRFYISLSLDKLQQERTDYTMLQFVGDVGAFFSTLMMAGGFICFNLAQLDVLLQNQIIQSVFRKKDYKTLKTEHITINYRMFIIALVKKILCLRHQRTERWRIVAQRRINREMDVTCFVRKQLIQGAFFKMMTTKMQRQLLTRHYSMLVAGPNETDTTSESATDGNNDFKGFKPSSILESQLLQATIKKKKTIKQKSFDVKDFIQKQRESIGRVDMSQVSKLYEESKAKLQKIKSIAQESALDLAALAQPTKFEEMYQLQNQLPREKANQLLVQNQNLALNSAEQVDQITNQSVVDKELQSPGLSMSPSSLRRGQASPIRVEQSPDLEKSFEKQVAFQSQKPFTGIQQQNRIQTQSQPPQPQPSKQPISRSMTMMAPMQTQPVFMPPVQSLKPLIVQPPQQQNMRYPGQQVQQVSFQPTPVYDYAPQQTYQTINNPQSISSLKPVMEERIMSEPNLVKNKPAAVKGPAQSRAPNFFFNM